MRRSLSARLSIWIVLVAALMFFGLFLYLARIWHTGVRNEVDKDAQQVLENAVLRLDDILDDVERTSDVLSWFVARDLEKPNMMIMHGTNTLRYDRELTSCSISFEPYYYRAKGEYYSIYSWHGPDGEILWEQEGDDTYRYFDKEWYTTCKNMGIDCWTEPYLDESNLPGVDVELLVSHCKPIYHEHSAFVGVISLDLSLKRLSEELYDVKPYANAFCILLGEKGQYLVHPDSEKLATHSIFSDAEELDQPGLAELGRAMGHQEKGKQVLHLNGEDYHVYYRPIPTTGWSIAIFCPFNDIYGGFVHLGRSILLAMCMCLLLMFFLFVWLIRRQLAPLGKLAVEADYIASGNFERPLPPARNNDEIGLLNRSFSNMQRSLIQHIQDLTLSTASRERMEKELQIARNIQMGMVPHNFQLRAGIDLYASMMPAREVGGDLYDFFLQDDKLYLCIGDVSGKGVPASLFMAVARSMFRIVARQGLAPAEIARRINDTVSEKNDQMIFVTMFLAAVDLKTGEMEYCNCGHNAPVLMESGKQPDFLKCKPNTAVGILPGYDYEGQTMRLNDKVLFLYTDGLNEAENAAHEQFGNERMLEELGKEPFSDAHTLVSRINAVVEKHVGGAERSDDMTMLCLKITL